MAILIASGSDASGDLVFRSAADWSNGGHELVAEWVFDEGVVVASSDRYGMIPIFYWTSGDVLLLSDSLAEICEKLRDARLDEGAVATYLRLGYYIGQKTLVEGVNVVPPNARLVWDGALSLVQNATGYALFDGNKEEAVKIYDALFSQAIKRRIGGGVGKLTLSGGRDSRHILLELNRQKALPAGVITLKRGNSNDHSVAAALAADLELRCELVEPSDDFLEKEKIKNRLNNYLTDENGWYVDILDRLEGPLFDGIAGDVLSNGLYFDAEINRYIQEGAVHSAASLFLSRFGGHVGFLSKWASGKFHFELAVNDVSCEFERYRYEPNPLKSFVFWNRTRREIALLPIGMARKRVEVCLPFLDADLVSFLLSLPANEYGEPGFHDLVLRSSFPQWSGFRFATKVKRELSLGERSRYSVKAIGALRGRFASFGRLSYYGFCALKGSNVVAVENPFSRLFPVVQAVDELKIRI